MPSQNAGERGRGAGSFSWGHGAGLYGRETERSRSNFRSAFRLLFCGLSVRQIRAHLRDATRKKEHPNARDSLGHREQGVARGIFMNNSPFLWDLC